MPVYTDLQMVKFEDGTFVVSLAPPAPIGGFSLRWQIMKRFGSTSGLVVKSAASGYGNNVSGINVTNSGAGVMQITLNSSDTSGLDYGNYVHALERLDSGSRTVISEGFFSVLPNVGG